MDYKQKYLKYKKKYIELKNQLGGNKELGEKYIECIKNNYKDCKLIIENTKEGNCEYSNSASNTAIKICKNNNSTVADI